MNENKTARGFAYIEFEDDYGHKCTLQKSSRAYEAIWLGRNDQDRMHLTQEQVAELLPYLENFVKHGTIQKL